ncbi:transposase [Paenibacillus terrae]|uniref:transposase n=1 Tax=Paenibacillus terrae TaxID=159743 RepID=UPI0006990C41|nr:transposase [Paenibacillus terrae]
MKSLVLPELQRLNIQLLSPCLPERCILDLDSTVETVYGNQEGAAVGVNAHKRGRKSYHPLLAFEGQSRLALHAALRPGNTHSSTDATAFVERTLSLLESRSLFESRGIGYVGKLKWTKRLQERVRECRDWKRYAEDDWIIEGITLLLYKATSWDKQRRVCVIRKAKRFAGDQLLLDQPELYWEYDMVLMINERYITYWIRL